jgi:hypothetical protein
MRKLGIFIVSLLLIFAFSPVQLKAEKIAEPPSNELSVELEKTIREVEILTARLDEINSIDKKNLTSAERRELRKEVKKIEQALTLNGGGVYVSVGALLLVIVLLIVLL